MGKAVRGLWLGFVVGATVALLGISVHHFATSINRNVADERQPTEGSGSVFESHSYRVDQARSSGHQNHYDPKLGNFQKQVKRLNRYHNEGDEQDSSENSIYVEAEVVVYELDVTSPLVAEVAKFAMDEINIQRSLQCDKRIIETYAVTSAFCSHDQDDPIYELDITVSVEGEDASSSSSGDDNGKETTAKFVVLIEEHHCSTSFAAHVDRIVDYVTPHPCRAA